MFDDFVLVCQNLSAAPLARYMSSFSFAGPPRETPTSSTCRALQGKKEADGSRAAQLVDELLLEIYNKGSSVSDYSSSVVHSREKIERTTERDLQQMDIRDVEELVGGLECDVVRMGAVLVRKLKRRDALRRQRDAHCDVISYHLHKHAQKAIDMRFAIEPAPGDSGFSQWHSAMLMVAQLPGGIPPEFRKKLWLALADRYLASRSVDWPRVERECFSEWSHPTDSELGVQIVKDLHRTGCSLFCGEDGHENQSLLKRVLLAYARWNKAVGYCQGFNMLAALILQVTDRCEYEALKLMIFLIEGVLPECYFADSLRGLSVDMAVFRELLRTKLPKLSRHLDTLQTAAKDGTASYEPPLTNVFTMQWFLTLFCNCLPQPTVLRVWDLILLEGNEILLRTALAIWQALEERILAVRSADEFYCIMGVLTREILEFGIVDANSLIKAIVTIGQLTELPFLRDKYLYNINPWSSSISSRLETRQLKLYGRERLAMDINALKKQYSKLKQRQRQAHIIFSAAVTRQPPPNAPAVAMNHLFLGRSSMYSIKRIGPLKEPTQSTSQPPATLLWKDAPPRQSSSSSSSDTELCDDSEDSNLSPALTPTSFVNNQLPEDNSAEKTSDNVSLMKLDNTHDEFIVCKDDYTTADLPDANTDKVQICDEDDVGNNVEAGDISVTITSEETDKDLFDFGRYGIQSDSDDDALEFEKFLESRIQCLQQSSMDDENTASSSEGSFDATRESMRKNSQRALQIMQENSLILHRILQCQSRLTPSPPLQEVEQTGAKRSSLNLSTDINRDEPIETLMRDNLSTLNLVKSPLSESHSEICSRSESTSFSYEPEASPVKSPIEISIPINLDFSTTETTFDLPEIDTLRTVGKPSPDSSDLTTSDDKFSDNTQVRLSYSSILDSKCSKSLDEKYEKLILKPSSLKLFDKEASSPKVCSPSPVSAQKFLGDRSPSSEARTLTSPGDGSAFARSPTSGRIYNPFPVNISSRQSKDVAFRLGLYKKL